MFETEAGDEKPPDWDPASPDIGYEQRGSRRFARGGVEYGRAIGFVDAIFAVASTLLVTTLDPGRDGWPDWSTFEHREIGPLFAFALSFVVIVWFWWSNHRFVATLAWLSPRFILATMAMLAFIVLIPFSSEALGTYHGDAGQVATVVYAVNVALASLSAMAMFFVAVHDGLFGRSVTRQVLVSRTLGMADTPIVFLLSVPIAIVWSPSAAHYFWLLLIPTGIVIGRWSRHRRAAPAGGSGPS